MNSDDELPYKMIHCEILKPNLMKLSHVVVHLASSQWGFIRELFHQFSSELIESFSHNLDCRLRKQHRIEKNVCSFISEKWRML